MVDDGYFLSFSGPKISLCVLTNRFLALEKTGVMPVYFSRSPPVCFFDFVYISHSAAFL